MRDAKSIINYLKKKGSIIRAFQPDKMLNAGLTQMFLDEEVVEALADDTGRNVNTLYLLTNKNRLIITLEDVYESKSLFKSDEYKHYGYIYDLNKTDFSKSSLNIYKENKIFGNSYDQLILRFTNDNGIENEVAMMAPLNKGKDLLNQIKKHFDKYSTPLSNKKKVNKNEEKLSQNNLVNDIRKLYEDGIITREEMLDLLKEAIKK